MSGILKRKFEEVDGSSPCSSVQESDDDLSGSESGDSFDSVNPSSSNHHTHNAIHQQCQELVGHFKVTCLPCKNSFTETPANPSPAAFILQDC